MVWINDKKAIVMVPQNGIIDCLKMYKMLKTVMNFICKAMKNSIVELTEGRNTLPEAKIHRGILQRDSLSPLLFVIAMMQLYYVIMEYTGSKQFTKSHERFITS